MSQDSSRKVHHVRIYGSCGWSKHSCLVYRFSLLRVLVYLYLPALQRKWEQWWLWADTREIFKQYRYQSINNKNFLWCRFYLIRLIIFFVNLTWRKQNRKQQHGGRLKLLDIHVSGFTAHPKFCRIYLTSESAPDSTMWFGPPSQSMAVDANLKMYDKISNVIFLNHMYLSLVYYEWLIKVEEIHQEIFRFWQDWNPPKLVFRFLSLPFLLIDNIW